MRRLILTLAIGYCTLLSLAFLLEELDLGPGRLMYDHLGQMKLINATPSSAQVYYFFRYDSGWRLPARQGLLSCGHTLAGGSEVRVAEDFMGVHELGVGSRNATGWAWKACLLQSDQVTIRFEPVDYGPTCPVPLAAMGRRQHQLCFILPVCVLLLMWRWKVVGPGAGVIPRLVALVITVQAAVSLVAYLHWPF